jgi:hypothetical protein
MRPAPKVRQYNAPKHEEQVPALAGVNVLSNGLFHRLTAVAIKCRASGAGRNSGGETNTDCTQDCFRGRVHVLICALGRQFLRLSMQRVSFVLQSIGLFTRLIPF